jgi:hypothetical protein
MDYETAQDVFDALSAPFPTDAIEWRIGSRNKEKTKGIALAYIDARAVMDRLDSICGPDGWQCNYTPAQGMLLCNLGIHFPGTGWTWKSDGAGATDVEAEKGMASDAFKRAAVRFGIGRYLYDLDSPWIVLENEGRKIPDGERKKLDEHHERAAQKVGWGGPTDVATYRVLLKVVQDTVTQPSDAIAFREKYKGMIPLLRVAQRRHLEQTLDRVGAQEAA